MPSSVFNCVKSEDVQRVQKQAAAYKKMGDLAVIKASARVAGGYLRTQMAKLVEGESSLSSFRDVGQAITVFEDDENVVVGIPPYSDLIGKAKQMDSTYQLADVAHDLAIQSDDVEEKFYDTLLGMMR